ncbi:hypothetical protein ABZU75_39160 [Streptosporangium sp. NPDC005286]|uniref:DUF1648 domain-containing protein n=1 Tax=Streptosporangium sp. NPDC005286 TaxID=3154463 RepID=UPI0033B36EEB
MMLSIAADLALVALVTCLMLVLPALARPTLPFGVRVTAERAGDPAIVTQRRSYTRLVVAVAAVAAVVSILTGQPAVTLGVLVAADLLLYYRAHLKVRAAKSGGGWAGERRQGITMDTTFRTDPVRVPWVWGLPALAVVLLTAGIGWWSSSAVAGWFEPVLSQVGLTLLVVVVILIVLRARPDLDAARPKSSARRYRIYLRGVATLSLLSAACLNLSLLIWALRQWGVVGNTVGWLVAGCLPLVALLGGWLVWETKVGQAGHRLPALPDEQEEDTGMAQRDDDRYWFLAGTIYANRRDPALLVHARLGSSSWTLNLGHPIAWLLLGFVVIGLAGLVLVTVFGGIDLPQKRGIL